MPATIARDYFISRAGADKALAIAIAKIVREAGFKTWLQDEDFGHASFMARMEQGLESGARVIGLLSVAYQASDYCRAEYNAALTGDPLNLKQRLIVFRIEDCAPTGNLSHIPYVDLVQILALTDVRQRDAALRREVRKAIGLKDGEAESAPTHRPLTQVLHDEIAPVPSFTGREPELAALAAALWNGGAAALTGSPAATALSGLGGVGKSVLAREYAWRERERYRGVWWLRAEERASLLADLIELGARFIPGLGEDPGREAAAHATLDFIAQTPAGKPWLLVYDNAASPAALEKLTPRAGAHVLVTSRWQDWHGRARELPLDVFSEEVAVEFLMAEARGAAERPAETRAAAAQLAEDLGRLPLALAIARAHAWSMGWTLAQYREHLAETKLLEREQTKGVDYPRSIAATFTLAIEKAKASAPEAERLLAIAAFLAPDRIPLDIVTAGAMSEIEKGEAVAALAEVSLVTRETLDDGSPAISLHRLVQEVMRRRLGEGAAEAAALATQLVADAYPSGTDPTDVRYWPACRRLEVHAAAVLAFAPDTGEPAQKTSLLLNQYALHLKARADFAQAEPLYRRTLALDEKRLGLGHPEVATDLNNLAQLLQATNRPAEAEPLMRRALAIDKESFGPGHPKVAMDLNNLAALLKATNRLAEAEPLLKRVVEIFEKVEQDTGHKHPNYAGTLNNLAVLLQATNRFAEAEPLLKRVVEIFEKVEQDAGHKHPNYAGALNNLAALLHVTNRLAEAEPLMRRALAIGEESFGPGHPNVAISLNNLAQLLQATNRLAEAEPLMRRALAIDEESFGPGHPNVASALYNLAALLHVTNRLAEAEPLLRRALAIGEESLGPGHPNVAIRLNNLATLLQATNRLAEAEPLMRRALAIFTESLGAEHPSTETVRRNLAVLLEAIEAAKQEAPEGPLAPALTQPHPSADAPAPEGKPGKAGLRGEGEPCPPQSAGPVPHGERGTAPRRGLFARWFGRG